MELGRECLKLWGYERVDEIIWVKTNQLQRIIRTGRTGHWLNHGKVNYYAYFRTSSSITVKINFCSKIFLSGALSGGVQRKYSLEQGLRL